MSKIHVKTYGCSANISESEQMMGLLDQANHKIVESTSESELIVLNLCTVKGDASALKHVDQIKNKFPDKKLVVSGCITPQLHNDLKKIPDISYCNTNSINKIVEVVDNALNGNSIEIIRDYKLSSEKLNLPKIRINPTIGIISILQGCTFECKYCSVVKVKGKAKSYAIKNILRDIRNSVNEGCKEIWITSQDNSAYGIYDKNMNLAILLENIVQIPDQFQIRVGMMNPILLLSYLDRLIKIFQHPKIFKFLHIPLQSGSDRILKEMGRGYKVKHFIEIVKQFRKNIPDITLATDVICGYPGETNLEFNDTLNVIKSLEIPIVNISRYSPRPETKAYLLPQLNGGIIKDRSRLLTKIHEEIAINDNKKWLHWRGPVLIDEKKSEKFIARNYAYKQIIIQGDYNLGEILTVKIVATGTYHLKGEVILKQ